MTSKKFLKCEGQEANSGNKKVISKQRRGLDLDNHNNEKNVRHRAMFCNPNFKEKETNRFLALFACLSVCIKELQIRLDHVAGGPSAPAANSR